MNFVSLAFYVQSDDETVVLLILSAEKLCTDSTTHARIDEQLLKVAFPGIVMALLCIGGVHVLKLFFSQKYITYWMLLICKTKA